jgi:uncharacterized membrane protein YphA (DoxX/SURF4 family)
MYDPRRYLGTFAVISLVLLRLVIGWHFFGEGTKKLQYDRRDGELRLAFSSQEFLNQAKGPLADWYRSQAPDEQGWHTLLASARENLPPSKEELAEESKWAAEYNRRRAEAQKQGEPVPFEFSPSAPYQEWATRIRDDWRSTVERFKSGVELTEEQAERAEKALQERLQQLSDYLAGESESIAEYRHELWRLEKWRKAPEAGDVPFHSERIAAKAAETGSIPSGWVNQVRQLEASLQNDLRGVLSSEQRAEAAEDNAVETALADPRESRLRMIDVAVTALTIGVGVCLLLGFFTRLAAIVGALFLLSVIASQPPWLADAAPTMPQFIELAGLLVLAGTAAGRWAGLDYFTYALFHRRAADEV